MKKEEERKITELERLIYRLDNMGLKQYVELSQKPGKILFWNFMSGVARGLGFTIGTAIILAVVFHMVGQLISMNIPYLTEVLQELVDMVQDMIKKR